MFTVGQRVRTVKRPFAFEQYPGYEDLTGVVDYISEDKTSYHIVFNKPLNPNVSALWYQEDMLVEDFIYICQQVLADEQEKVSAKT